MIQHTLLFCTVEWNRTVKHESKSALKITLYLGKTPKNIYCFLYYDVQVHCVLWHMYPWMVTHSLLWLNMIFRVTRAKSNLSSSSQYYTRKMNWNSRTESCNRGFTPHAFSHANDKIVLKSEVVPEVWYWLTHYLLSMCKKLNPECLLCTTDCFYL